MDFSPIGFGSYRIDISIREHYDALVKALTGGINLIDTSANYSDGGSEMLIGKVINDLISENRIKREEITLVTKGGYIQGKNYKHAEKLRQEGDGFTGVVEYSEGLWHSISKDFLQDQIDRQIQRLNQSYIDVYLLHNPEYYLSWAKKRNIPGDEARDIYYDRIRKAFEFLESKVEEGKILAYGISSNTFPVHSNEFDFTSLEEVINIAISISVDNHFKFIQLPLNLFEAGAIVNQNQINNSETVLELADKAGLKVLINRPLNAITSKGLVRLSDFKSEPFLEKDFIRQIKLVSMMEEDLINETIPRQNLTPAEAQGLIKILSFGNLVDKNWKFFGSIEHYKDVLEQLFVPRINYLINFFEGKIINTSSKEMFQKYIRECYKLLNFVTNYYKLRAEKRSIFIHSLIDKFLDNQFKSLSLSQKSILLLKSIKGVSCVLVGARKEEYVDDILRISNEDKIDNASEVIKYVSSEIENASY